MPRHHGFYKPVDGLVLRNIDRVRGMRPLARQTANDIDNPAGWKVSDCDVGTEYRQGFGAAISDTALRSGTDHKSRTTFMISRQ